MSVRIIQDNKILFSNIIGAFLLRGMGMVLSVFSLPLYMSYFPDNIVLGVWFTVITVLSWVLSFDLGIGNGLRNNLTKALTENNYEEARRLVSSAYLLLGFLTVCISLFFMIFSRYVDWNSILNISSDIFPTNSLMKCVNILVVGIFLSFFLRLINSILFALQYSSVNNLLSFITQVLLVGYLFVITPNDSMIDNFVFLSYYYSFVINFVLFIATVFVFTKTKLKNCFPSCKYYNRNTANSVLSLGIKFLIAQVLYMVISVTNEWFVSKFYGPEYCVEYQIYYKVFFVVISLYHLALTPLWSAITKAYSEKRYIWLIKLQKILYLSTVLLMLIQLLVILFIQFVLDIWLGDRSIEVNYQYAFVFAFFSIINIWIGNVSVFNSGIGILDSTIICYLVAVLVKILGIILFSSYFNWIFVVVITSLSLIPYCILIPIHNSKKINELISV